MLKHLVSAAQISKELLKTILAEAAYMEWLLAENVLSQMLRGKRLATLFYQPSTRTRFSFEAAMLALGGTVISTENAKEFSSAAKGEALEDTVRVVSGYAHGIVIRHPEKGIVLPPK